MQAKIYVQYQTTKPQSNSGNVGLDAIETTEDERAHMFWMLMLMLRSTLMLPLMLISMSEQLQVKKEDGFIPLKSEKTSPTKEEKENTEVSSFLLTSHKR